MNAIEFSAPIQDGMVQIPKEYQEIYNQDNAQIFIIPTNNIQLKSKIRFGLAKNKTVFLDDIMAENMDINEMFYGG